MRDPDTIGVCPQCRGSLIRTRDPEKRSWAKCTDCGAQFPLEQGRPIVDKLSDKVDGNSFVGVK